MSHLLINDVGIDVMLAAASHFEHQQDLQMKTWAFVLRLIAHNHRNARLTADSKSETVQFTHGDDITVRLTRWCEQFTDRTETQALMDQAAREIERLRLTDAEREAIEYAIVPLERMVLRPDADHHADVLRKLLERMK